MSPELLSAIGIVLAAVLGPTGIAVLRRRRDPDPPPAPAPSPAAEVREAGPALSVLAAALKVEERRADELERRILLCPTDPCPVLDQVRDHLRREGG